MMLEFCECQLQFVRVLLSSEERDPGFVSRTLERSSRVRNILDYCLSVLEMAVCPSNRRSSVERRGEADAR